LLISAFSSLQLAHFHAAFMGDTAVLDKARTSLWPWGGYWDLEKRSFVPTEIADTPRVYAEFLARFQDDGNLTFRDPEVALLGKVLSEKATVISEMVRSLAIGESVWLAYSIHSIMLWLDCRGPKSTRYSRPW
jgi:hypothetical protein